MISFELYCKRASEQGCWGSKDRRSWRRRRSSFRLCNCATNSSSRARTVYRFPWWNHCYATSSWASTRRNVWLCKKQKQMSTVRMGNHRSSVPCVYIKYHQHVECKAQWQLLRGWRSLIQENFQQVYNQEFGIVISSLGQHTVEISSERKRWCTHKLRRASKIVWNTNFDSISNVGECSNSRWSWTNC